MIYVLKVTYGDLEFYYHEGFYTATYSPNVMKISTMLGTVTTYALDWGAIIAHIPWISHSMSFGLFYGTFYVEVGNFSRAKLEEKIPLLDIFVEEKKIIFCLENGNLLMPALWVVNIHRNQHG